ncbi:MAG: 2OG-Fe(II) oxygenase [Alphaproteobacteria bacterium]|nr:2OG-Fe(II) oxygenase [Alphaproteobacteria bacterium]
MAVAFDDFALMATIGDVFTPGECDRIVETGQRMEAVAGGVNDPKAAAGQNPVRDAVVRGLPWNADYGWIYERLLHHAAAYNQKSLGFELEGAETAQLLSYGPGQHYDWHVDIGTSDLASRKLSLLLPLSDPADYDGGELELFFSDRPTPATRNRGSLIVFPSFVLHRVRAISRGRRFSLALWLRGAQRFR